MIQVLCAIIIIDTKILVAQRSKTMKMPLKWEFPGGKLEENESEIDCIKREIKEEINIEQLNCPKCKTHLLKKGGTAYGCANFRECGFKIPFEILGKKLTDKQIYELLAKGKTGKIKGLIIPGATDEKEGKLVMEADFNIGVE